MKKSILNKDIPKSCNHCFFGKKSTALNLILCKFRGPVSEENFCGKYKYDPLKRIPKTTNKLPTFSAEDFSL